VAKAKKAQGVTALDMRRICSFCDYFVILSATSLRQVNAIAQAIEEDLAKHRIKSLRLPPMMNQAG
jgi:ribosome-associated protein